MSERFRVSDKFRVVEKIKRWPGLVLSVVLGLLLSTGTMSAGAAQTELQVGNTVLKDPTRPAGWSARRVISVPENRPEVKLNSIIYSPDRRLAVINGQSLAEGQQNNGIRVIKIERRRVLLEWQGGRWYASLQSASDGSLSIRRTQ